MNLFNVTTAFSLYRYEKIIPDLIPFALALALTNAIILISHQFPGAYRLVFQAASFTLAVSVSLTYLLVAADINLEVFWNTFVSLSMEVKLSLSIVVIVTTYFGGGMYFVSPEEEEGGVVTAIHMPATCDAVVTFTVPDTLPNDPKALFEFAFEQ